MILYKIENTSNQHSYIGMTTRALKERWGQHKTALKGNKHKNRYLQAAWNLYGAEKFTISQIASFSSFGELVKAEQDLIATSKGLYNLAAGGLGGGAHVERKVIGMSVKTGEVIRFRSASEAGRNGFDVSTVFQCCVNKVKVHRGHVWSYEEDSGQLVVKKQKAKAGRSTRRTIYKFSSTGEFIGIVDRNLNSKKEVKGITSACSGKRLTYQGFLFSYTKNIQSQLQKLQDDREGFLKLDKKNKVIARYGSLKQLLEDNPFITSTSNIYRCCLKERKTAHGFGWSFSGVGYCS